MKKTSIEKLSELQKNASNIRNICILAHVDHGKTTLADALVASNGIISQKMAGKLRYLDSREDEQVRGITMKSSAISLHFHQRNEEYLINLIDSPGHVDFSSEVSTAVRLCDGALVLVDVVEGICPQTHAVLRQSWLENIKPVLVLNKIDRLLTDWKLTPNEAQTHLQQLLEQINAITGALFTNEILAKSSQAVAVSNETSNPEVGGAMNANEDQVFNWSSGLEESDDSLLYFSPELGNVVFASAIDGWGFRIDQFAELYARKVGVSARVLNKTLWGDYYLEGKTKTVRKGAQAKGKKTLFVQLILENIWKVYDVVLVRRDKELTEKIVQTLGLVIKTPNKDVKLYLQTLFNQWLPLSTSILSMVCDKLPSPLMISEERIEKLLCATSHRFNSLPLATQELKKDFLLCSSSDEAPLVVFVSKMFTVDANMLPKNRARPLTMEEIVEKREAIRSKQKEKLEKVTTEEFKETECSDTISKANHVSCEKINLNDTKETEEEEADKQIFIAFARVFSGTIKKGQTLYILSPKHDPTRVLDQISVETKAENAEEFLKNVKHVETFCVKDLYMFMGRELECLDQIPAGNVLGIGGLDQYILKSATISSTISCPSFTDMYLEATPIVRVIVEPKNPVEMKQFVDGLRLLNQSDPCVEILVQETGEHVVIAAGEVHLQKCLDDLRYRFAKIKINVSAPTVSFRESIIPPPTVDRVNEVIQSQNQGQPSQNQGQTNKPESSLIELSTTNGLATLRVRALPLSPKITKVLEENYFAIKTLNQYNLGLFSDKSLKSHVLNISEETLELLKEFKTKLENAFHETGEEVSNVTEKIWSIGPKRNCTNLLINRIEGYNRPSIWGLLEKKTTIKSRFSRYDSSIVSGFQLATLAGPLCEEPMMGVCFLVESWDLDSLQVDDAAEFTANGENKERNSINGLVNKEDEDDEKVKDDPLKSSNAVDAMLRGQLITCMKECCRRSFQMHPQRLMWAMYTCDIQATADVLGKMYAVLGKRHGRVLFEDLKEGTTIFNITALLPVAESFGLADEIRKRTSGLASPQLKFSHWELIDIDPFWVPTTEEEYLHFGEKADSANVAQKHMNDVRRRKGLKVNEKIIEFAEKQRTLKKNK